MENILLLSTAYSWFVGLLVMMIVMTVLFIVIALFALKPIKVDEAQNDSSEILNALERYEAEVASSLLKGEGDAQSKKEIEGQLRDVATAKKLVKQLLSVGEQASTQELGVDKSLTEAEKASLENDEKVAIEQTFTDAQKGADGDNGLKKSFTAMLIQASDNVKAWYFELKNCILCYEKTKVRMRWNNEKFYVGKNNVATLTMRGKQLCLYLAVNPADYAGTYPVKASTSEMYKQVTPCLFRIKNDKSVKQAKELIALLMSDYGVMYVRTNHSIYALPYQDDDALVAKGLAKKD